MTRVPEYSVFVNSTDSFEDTWEPFFHLLHDYWPQAGRVVLNTERKSFAHSGVAVECTQVAKPGEGRIPWGECMVRALNSIPTEVFVYMQDDYFLYDHVKTEIVDEAARILIDEDLDCLRLMECGGTGPWGQTPYDWLWSLTKHAKYRISLQAGLWTKSGMRKYIRAHESPWQMEVWGSRRASRIDGRIWCVSRDVFGDGQPQVIPYVPTGIVKGRWNRDAVADLFEQHEIELPFEIRGWWDPESPPRSTLLQKILKAPKYGLDRVRSL